MSEGAGHPSLPLAVCSPAPAGPGALLELLAGPCAATARWPPRTSRGPCPAAAPSLASQQPKAGLLTDLTPSSLCRLGRGLGAQGTAVCPVWRGRVSPEVVPVPLHGVTFKQATPVCSYECIHTPAPSHASSPLPCAKSVAFLQKGQRSFLGRRAAALTAALQLGRNAQGRARCAEEQPASREHVPIPLQPVAELCYLRRHFRPHIFCFHCAPGRATPALLSSCPLSCSTAHAF